MKNSGIFGQISCKFEHFVNFSYIYFRAKMSSPPSWLSSYTPMFYPVSECIMQLSTSVNIKDFDLNATAEHILKHPLCVHCHVFINAESNGVCHDCVTCHSLKRDRLHHVSISSHNWMSCSFCCCVDLQSCPVFYVVNPASCIISYAYYSWHKKAFHTLMCR